MAMREQEIRAKIFQDLRPWGHFRQFTHGEKCTVKILKVEEDQILSLQLHHRRDELWVMLDDGLCVQLDSKIFYPRSGDEIVILRETKHRLSSVGSPGRVLEISFGEFHEDDIVRFDDLYGRA
ncbi:MAG: phosphomannose isomerase type II C-terminal cupin domain [Actinomycetota bacterium]